MSTKSQSPQGQKPTNKTFYNYIDGVTLPLKVQSYSQATYNVQSLIKVSLNTLTTINEKSSPEDCDLNDLHNCLSLANTILDHLCNDIEKLENI